MERLFLTGGEGFTGKHLSAAARATGFSVMLYGGDILDADRLKREVAEFAPTALIHLAAISAVTHEDETEIYRVNVLGTQSVLRACTALGSSELRVLVASSANIYGNAAQSPIAEYAKPSPQNHYAISKLACEYVCDMFADRLSISIARPFNYTGPGHDTRFVIPKIIDAYRARASRIELGNLDVRREFNDVRFVAQAYLSLLKTATPGARYNICTGKSYSLKNVLETVSRISGHRLEIVQNPAFMRANEIAELCGDPTLLSSVAGDLPVFTLEDTLDWMLRS